MTVESTACIAGGICLMICGLALFRLHPPNWQNDGELAADQRLAIQRWGKVQRVVRFLNNSLLFVIGAAILVAGLIPHGRTWVLLWLAIFAGLLICILFASIDAFSSLAGYKRALPEAARRSFQEHTPDSSHNP